MQKGLLSALVFLIVAAGAVAAWYALWKVTKSHNAATALFTALAFAAAATALYFQHRAIAETRHDVERTAEALEKASEAQSVQAALLEYSARLNAVIAEASATQGIGANGRLQLMRKGIEEVGQGLQARLRQMGAGAFLDPPPGSTAVIGPRPEASPSHQESTLP